MAVGASGQPVGRLFTARLVWGALLNGVVLYGVVLWFLAPGTAAAPGGRGSGPLAVVLRLMAVAAGVSAWVIFRRSFPASRGPQALPRYVMVWALCESVGLYGLVLGLLTRDIPAAAPFLLGSAGLLLVFRPRSEQLVD